MSVPITDDDMETFTLMLSNASGAGFANNDNEATGTIRNTETTARPDLTASFEGMPAEHRGEGGFHFRVAFSEDIGISFRALREDAFTVTGGRVTGGSRVDGRRDLFKMTVRPDSDGDVTITLAAGRECATSGAICTKGENRRQLTNSPSATVAGPVGISVADARVEEGAGAMLEFAVTLSRAAAGQVTVDYQTANGAAAAGTDYTAANGTLTFRAGESSKTVEVAVLDDSHDEGEETMTLRLLHPSEGRLADTEATGTIENADPLPRALLARVAPSWGGQAMSGADALWGRDTMEGLGAAGPGSGDRIDAELGYALPVGSRLVGTPRFGVTTSEYGRDYRLGYSLAVVQGGAMSFQFGLDAQRRESLGRGDADHSLVGRLTVGW